MPKLLHATAKWLENIMPIWGWCAISTVNVSFSLINILWFLPNSTYPIICLIMVQILNECVIYLQWRDNKDQKNVLQSQATLIQEYEAYLKTENSRSILGGMAS